jgi:uncharacterized protein (DUF58 family)
MELEGLMNEINAEVERLIDAFMFLLKYRILFRGGGVEFAGLKDYVPGEDDATRIDWKSSLKSQKIYVKMFEEERDLDIFVLLDTCSSMLFGTQQKLKSEYAAVAAGVIARAAVETGDNVGFAVYSDEPRHFLEPSNDESQYYHILKVMVMEDVYGGKCNLEKALDFVVNNVRERTVLFIISDFLGLEEGWDDSLKMARGKFNDVYAVMVRDMRDEVLPEGSGNFRLEDPCSGEVMVVNLDKVRKEYERLAKEQCEMVESVCRDSNVGFVKVFTTEPFVKGLVQTMELRRGE